MDLGAFVASLPPASLASVYASPDAAVAVLRGLPPLARAYAARLAETGGGAGAALAPSVVGAWPAPGADAKHAAALAALAAVGVTSVDGDSGALTASPAFCAHVAAAAARGRPPRAAPVSPAAAAAAPPAPDRDAHADAAWDGLLLYVGGERRDPPAEAVAGGVMDVGALVEGAGLVAGSGGQRKPTPAGLAFLLATTPSQLWTVLTCYARCVPPASVGDVVALLLRLAAGGGAGGAAPPPLAAAALPPAQAAAAADAATLGLLLPYVVEGATYYAPTRLAAALAARKGGAGETAAAPLAAAASPNAPSPAAPGDGYIVVETNFRVYAYTASPARRAALARVAAVERILPDLTVATLTRGATLAAVDAGVPAATIVSFLRDHASPHVAARVPAVPETVTDQLRLWAASRDRVAAVPAVLYDNFDTPAELAAAVGAAEGAGALLWRGGRGGGRVVARADAHDAVVAAIRGARK